MTDLAPFPDVELALHTLLGDLGRIVTETPANLLETVTDEALHRVTCIGGTDDTVTDVSRVDVDSFALTKPLARAAAEAVRQRLLAGPHVVGAVVLDRTRTDVKPHEVPWVGSPPPYRYTASYQITARR